MREARTSTEETTELDRLGDEITKLCAHIQAATCRWLCLVAQFDRREGWGTWGCKSCAHWLSWRCSIEVGVAREHVRVARRLTDLPVLRAAFARGELSYSKVRALTRIVDVEREDDLLELAQHATAAQLERIVRGYRRVMAAEDMRAHDERFLRVTHDDDGSVVLRGRLAREDGALLLKALEAMRSRAPQDSAETPSEDVSVATRNADALVAIADAALAAPATGGRTGGDRYQVVVHVDAPTLGGDDPGGRCELDDQAPLAGETVRRLSCDASVVTILEAGGKPLSVGRKTRSIPPALRRALRSRDTGCRFPGCTQRRHVDGHHIQHWANGGATSIGNLVQLCRRHHRLVHEGGYGIHGSPAGTLVFRRPDGRDIPHVPRSPRGHPDVPTRLARRLDTRITATTCVPRWYGEPLHLADAVDAVLATTAFGANPRDG
jgi:hypothetical protein